MPTGTLLEDAAVYAFLSKVPGSVMVVLDQAYVEYLDINDITSNVHWIFELSHKLIISFSIECEYMCNKWPRICYICRRHFPNVFIWLVLRIKKSLKIPKGQSESVNRSTYNIMTSRRTNNYLQNTTQKTTDRATRIPVKTGNELGLPRMWMCAGQK
jgi:hypothetical protein